MKKVEFKCIPVTSSARPIRFHEELCIGCGSCADVCQVDVMIPSMEQGKPPVVLYPGECYYCGSCAMSCPIPGAIELIHPLMNRTRFVDIIRPKEGEHNDEK